MKVQVIGVLCLLVTACAASVPVPMPGPKKTARPPSEVINHDALVPRQGAGAIVVRRDKTRFWRKGCIYDVALDGRSVAGLRNGEQVTFYADPGGRVVAVSIRPEENKCDAIVAEVPVRVVASATTSIRIVADVSYDLHVESTTY
jgi:hypothetical protein